MEKLKAFWEVIAPYFSGGLAGMLITCIVIPIIKGVLTKATAKLNVDALLEKQTNAIDGAVNKAVERVQGVTLSHSIQPLVESELKRVGEIANEQVKDSVKALCEQNAALLAVLKAQAAYFDDSIVSDEKKAALRDAIKAADGVFAPTAVESVAEIAPEEVVAPKKSKKVEVVR